MRGAAHLLPGVPIPVELAGLPRMSPAADRAGTARRSGRTTVATCRSLPAPPERPRWWRPERAPLAHFLDWYPATFGLGPTDRFAILSGVGYDPLLRDVFDAAHRSARRLYVPAGDLPRDPVRLAGLADASSASPWLHLTPAARPGCSPRCRRRAARAAAGARRRPAHLRRRGRAAPLAPAARLVNIYGTTETPQAQALDEIPGAVGHGAEPVPVGHGASTARELLGGSAGRATGRRSGSSARWWSAAATSPTGTSIAELTRRRSPPSRTAVACYSHRRPRPPTTPTARCVLRRAGATTR